MKKRQISLLIVLSLFISGLLILTIIKCSRSHQKNIRVILITLDTQRYDYISALHTGNASTPNIDSLAEKGTLFENCYSEIPITLPSHASIFYSLPPHKLQIYNNGQVLPKKKDLLSLAEIFHQKGFNTAAFTSLGVLKSQFGLNNGFNTYDDKLPGNRWYLNAEEVNSKVFPWLESQKDNNFFLWIHYSDPHLPYAPPNLPPDLSIYLNGTIHSQLCIQKGEKHSLQFNLTPGKNIISFKVLNNFPEQRDDYRIRLKNTKFINTEELELKFKELLLYDNNAQKNMLIKEKGCLVIFNKGKDRQFTLRFEGDLNLFPCEQVELYKKEVEYMDKQIGELIKTLNRLNLYKNTIIILTGDHGEGLGENKTNLGEQYFGHIHYLYNIYMKVPLIITKPFPNSPGERTKTPVALKDIAPTILGIMGWKKKKYHSGKDLYLGKNQVNSLIFEATYTPEAIYDRFAVLNFPWHLIFTPSEQYYELFNLQTDTDEKINIYQKMKNLEEIKRLQRMLKQHALGILNQKKDIKIDKKNLEMLKSLGYIK